VAEENTQKLATARFTCEMTVIAVERLLVMELPAMMPVPICM